ncbi:hypothetical protein WMF38_56585 [Sorangium sp. So ce118]
MVASLVEALTRAGSLGDVAAARVVHEAIGRLLELSAVPEGRACSRPQGEANRRREVTIAVRTGLADEQAPSPTGPSRLAVLGDLPKLDLQHTTAAAIASRGR